jgi:hypothetical protein
MDTPPTRETTKSVRLTPEVHARLSRVADGLNGTMNDAIAWLLDPNTLRIRLTEDQKKRWAEAAGGNGIELYDFVVYRVEASLHYGADPGVIRRIHDMTLALTRAHNIIPNPSTPGAARQVVTAPPEHRP